MKADPCQKQACAIQKCLQEHNYQEEACVKFIEEMHKCCDKWKDMSGCCSGFLKESKRAKEREASPMHQQTNH